MEYLSAFTIGLLGSLHCVGMCGPIAFALPLNRESNFSIVSGSLLYNLGRLFTYFILGNIFGLLGKGFAMAGFQRSLSIAVGIGMILSILIPYFYQHKYGNIPALNSWLSRVKNGLGQRLGRKSHLNLWTIGLLNGLLPCGLVYMALAGAVAMATPFDGGIFMFAFGLGTIPLMLSVSIFGSKIQLTYRNKIKKIIPYFVIAIGLLFILRGMNLGIPYVSPKIDNKNEMVECH